MINGARILGELDCSAFVAGFSGFDFVWRFGILPT